MVKSSHGVKRCVNVRCQNRVSKGTNQRCGLHSSASIFVYSASITELGLKHSAQLPECPGIFAVYVTCNPALRIYSIQF